MLKIFVFAVSVSIFSSCHAQKDLSFNAYKQTFVLNLPRGYKLKKHSGEEGIREYHVVYPDSCIVFIMDDNKSGSAFNKYKLQKFSKNVVLKITRFDTLTLGGIQPDRRYWKEIKHDQVVIGYMNILKEKIAVFDQVLSSLSKGNRTEPK